MTSSPDSVDPELLAAVDQAATDYREFMEKMKRQSECEAELFGDPMDYCPECGRPYQDQERVQGKEPTMLVDNTEIQRLKEKARQEYQREIMESEARYKGKIDTFCWLRDHGYTLIVPESSATDKPARDVIGVAETNLVLLEIEYQTRVNTLCWLRDNGYALIPPDLKETVGASEICAAEKCVPQGVTEESEAPEADKGGQV